MIWMAMTPVPLNISEIMQFLQIWSESDATAIRGPRPPAPLSRFLSVIQCPLKQLKERFHIQQHLLMLAADYVLWNLMSMFVY